MGFSKKHQMEGGIIESEGKKWLIAGIGLRAPLRSISTKPKEPEDQNEADSTTPTGKEAKIPERLLCPPAPRKRRPTSTNHHNGANRVFFAPPDLDSVFIPLNMEKAN